MKCKKTIVCLPECECCEGPQGPRGPRGPQGPQGSVGPQGSPAPSDAAYIWQYGSSGLAAIPSGGVPSSAIPFASAGTIIGSAISHVAGAATIGLSAGTYEVTYYVNPDDITSTFAMAVFTGAPGTLISETVYGKGISDPQFYGQTIFTTTSTSITLRNVGTQNLTLNTVTDSVCASIVIKKIS